jgi:uncharacterized protein (TIGR03437 family)
VTPSSTPIAGHVADAQATIAASVQITFGDTPGQLIYAGLAPGSVGLYQFNVTVPTSAPDGDLPLGVLLNGAPISQTLFIPVKAGQN